MKINSHSNSLFLDKELQAKKISEINKKDEAIFENKNGEPAAIIKQAPIVCFCGTYNHMGKINPNMLEPKERPIRIKQYMEDNPVVKKILHKYNDWLKEDVTKIPNNTDNFKKFLEEHPGAKKRASEHMGFFNQYLNGWRSFQSNPSTKLETEDTKQTIKPAFNPLEVGAPPKPVNIDDLKFKLPGGPGPNSEEVKVRIPKTKLHGYIKDNPEVKEVLKDYSNWANENDAPLKEEEEEVFNKYLANTPKAKKYAIEHEDFFKRLFKRFENISFNLFQDFIA